MLLNCPICNKGLKEKGEQIIGGTYSVGCYDCGEFDIEVELSHILRRKYLSFNLDLVMGRENYEDNLKVFRDYVRFHRPPLLTQSAIHEMVFLHRP